MSRAVSLAVVAALAAAAAGVFSASTTPGGDINALPSGPKSTATRDSRQDAEAAYQQARAECRRVPRDERRDCIAQAQRDFDKTLRQPPRPPRRSNAPAAD